MAKRLREVTNIFCSALVRLPLGCCGQFSVSLSKKDLEKLEIIQQKAVHTIRGLEDVTCEVRLQELSLLSVTKRKIRRNLLGTKSDLKDNYKAEGAKLVIADVIRRDNEHKLQTRRFQLDIKKTEKLPKNTALHWKS